MSDTQEPRDRRFIAAASLIGLILVAGVAVVVLRLVGGGDDAPEAGGATTANPTASPSKSAGSSSACGLPDGSQAIPDAAPETDWDLQGKMAAPASKVYGPANDEQGVHSCFARNPAGALFASVRFYSDAFALGDSLGVGFVERWYVDGPSKEKALSLVQADQGGSSDRSPVPQQVAGFRIDSYTPDRVTTTLVTRESDGPTAGELRAFPVTVVWTDGDWKVDIDSSSLSTPTRIASLSGFIGWSGVS